MFLLCRDLKMTLKDRLYDSWYDCCQWAANQVSEYDIVVKGNVPSKDALVAATHASYLDAPALILGLQQKMVFPSWWRSFPWVGCVDVREGVRRDTVDRFEQYVARGYSIGIFPEGRINPEGVVGEVTKGAFFFARHFNRDLIPVAIKGVDAIWPRHNKIFTSLRGKIVLNCGSPFEYTGRASTWAPRLREQLQALYNAA